MSCTDPTFLAIIQHGHNNTCAPSEASVVSQRAVFVLPSRVQLIASRQIPFSTTAGSCTGCICGSRAQARWRKIANPPSSSPVFRRVLDIYTVVVVISRAMTPQTSLRALDDIHRSVSDPPASPTRLGGRRQPGRFRATARRFGWNTGEGNQSKDALIQALMNSYGWKMQLLPASELHILGREQRTSENKRLTVSTKGLPHTPGNVDVKCLKCDRARGSLGRGLAKKVEGEKVDSHSLTDTWAFLKCWHI